MSAHPSNRSFGAFVRGAAFGAAAMYMLDPDRGRRRRAIARDKTARLVAEAEATLCEASRDLANRAHGARARARHWVHGDAHTDDLRLIERVRARLGRVVTHPHAIQIGARDARVTVSGPILAHEVAPLLAVVRAVPGVTGVDEHLVVHAQPGSVPSLQGTGRRRNAPRELPAFDTPAARAAALVGGGLLVLLGLARRSAGGLVLAGLGAGLAARGTHRPARNTAASGPDHGPPAAAPRSEAEPVDQALDGTP